MKSNKLKRELLEKQINNENKPKLIKARNSVLYKKNNSTNGIKLPKLIIPFVSFFITCILCFLGTNDIFISLFISLFLNGIFVVWLNKSLFFNKSEDRQKVIEKIEITQLIKKYENILSEDLINCLNNINNKLNHLKLSSYKYIFDVQDIHLIESINNRHVPEILFILNNCHVDDLDKMKISSLNQLEDFDKKLKFFIEQETKEIEKDILRKKIYTK